MESQWSDWEGPREKGGPTQTLTHRPPPERVSVGGEVGVGVFLGQIDQEGGEDEHQEPDVPGGDQLLQGQLRVRALGGPRRRGRSERGTLRPLGEVGRWKIGLWEVFWEG